MVSFLKSFSSKVALAVFASVLIVVLVAASGIALARRSASCAIIAAGEIDWTGTVNTGYNIASVYWDTISKEYHIYITGVDYDFQKCITVVTPTGGPCIAWTNSAGGMLVVQLVENGVAVQSPFSFVSYRVT